MNQNSRTTRLVGSALALVLAAAAPACLDASDEPTEAPIATLLASSATTSSLGVTTWEVRADGDAFLLTGRSASAERVVELGASALVGDQIVLTALHPEQGTVTITRDGRVMNPTNPAVAALGAAVFADLGTVTHSAPRDGVPEPVAARTIFLTAAEGHIGLWSLFGYSWNGQVASTCPVPRELMRKSAIPSVNPWGGWTNPFCKETGWFVPLSTFDCRFKIEINVPGQVAGTCDWWLQQPISVPD